MQAAALAGLVALGWLTHGDVGRVLSTTVGVAFALVVDQVANAGGGEALVVDTLGCWLLPSYAKRVRGSCPGARPRAASCAAARNPRAGAPQREGGAGASLGCGRAC